MSRQVDLDDLEKSEKALLTHVTALRILLARKGLITDAEFGEMVRHVAPLVEQQYDKIKAAMKGDFN